MDAIRAMMLEFVKELRNVPRTFEWCNFGDVAQDLQLVRGFGDLRYENLESNVSVVPGQQTP